MKTVRKFFVLLTILVILLSGFTFASATNRNTLSVSDQFIQLCNDMYTNESAYVILNKNGADITDSYYENTAEWYQNGDFTSISLYYRNHVGRFIKYESSTRGSYQTVTTGIPFMIDVDISIASPYELFFTLYVRFTYNINTGKISSATASLTLDNDGSGYLVSPEINNLSTSATISPDKYSITVSCQFYVNTVLSIPLGDYGEIEREELTGPYSYSYRAYGE